MYRNDLQSCTNSADLPKMDKVITCNIIIIENKLQSRFFKLWETNECSCFWQNAFWRWITSSWIWQTLHFWRKASYICHTQIFPKLRYIPKRTFLPGHKPLLKFRLSLAEKCNQKALFIRAIRRNYRIQMIELLYKYFAFDGFARKVTRTQFVHTFCTYSCTHSVHILHSVYILSTFVYINNCIAQKLIYVHEKWFFFERNGFFSDFLWKAAVEVCELIKKMNNNTERTKEFYLMNSYRFELVLYFKNEGIIHFCKFQWNVKTINFGF